MGAMRPYNVCMSQFGKMQKEMLEYDVKNMDDYSRDSIKNSWFEIKRIVQYGRSEIKPEDRLSEIKMNNLEIRYLDLKEYMLYLVRIIEARQRKMDKRTIDYL